MMKKYTEKDLETFKRDEQERLICPHGDYTEIKNFPARCCFAMGSSFGERSNFGDGCTFGVMCVFGMESTFGMGSRFGGGSNFGGQSTFGEACNFDDWNSFGNACGFGKQCSFGESCGFGERSRFGEKCSHEGLTNSIYIAIDRIGSELRKTYFFKAEEGYFVRAGCFFGTLDKFKEQVHETHRGTIHETTCLMACELAVKLLDSQWKE